MGILVIAGCDKSGWEKMLAVFPSHGELSAGFDEIFNEPKIINPTKLCQPLSTTPDQHEKISKLVADKQGEGLMIADSRNAGLLDFWAECFPDARFLLFYSSLENAIANAFLVGINPQLFLSYWLSTNRQFLAFQRRHRQRTILLNVELAFHNPHAMIDLLKQHGITVDAQLFGNKTSPEELPAEGLLAGVILAEQPEVLMLSGELEACAYPLNSISSTPGLDPEDLFYKFQQRNNQQLLLKSEVLQLHSEIATISQNNRKLEPAYREVAQENELLLLQLEQVQEELEVVFQQKQQLEITYPQTKPPMNELIKEEGDRAAAKLTSKSLFSKLLAVLPGRKNKRTPKSKTLASQIMLLKDSGMFDERWYLSQYPDVARAGIDPIKHYLCHGVAEGRNPSPDFDTQYYLSTNPDVVASEMNPLLHYVSYGKNEGRNTTYPRNW